MKKRKVELPSGLDVETTDNGGWKISEGDSFEWFLDEDDATKLVKFLEKHVITSAADMDEELEENLEDRVTALEQAVEDLIGTSLGAAEETVSRFQELVDSKESL